MSTITEPLTWTGCYDDNWKGTITDEAFAHPAKFAKGLIERIADYLGLPRGAVVVKMGQTMLRPVGHVIY